MQLEPIQAAAPSPASHLARRAHRLKEQERAARGRAAELKGGSAGCDPLLVHSQRAGSSPSAVTEAGSCLCSPLLSLPIVLCAGAWSQRAPSWPGCKPRAADTNSLYSQCWKDSMVQHKWSAEIFNWRKPSLFTEHPRHAASEVLPQPCPGNLQPSPGNSTGTSAGAATAGVALLSPRARWGEEGPAG